MLLGDLRINPDRMGGAGLAGAIDINGQHIDVFD